MSKRVTEEEKERMKELRASGMTYVAIGAAIGRSHGAVSYVCNPEYKARQKAYQQTTESKAYQRAYQQTPKGKLRCNLRARLYIAINGNYKAGSAVRDLGCSIDELKLYLENKFRPDMTWNNWAHDGWHIDHIKPLASFDLTNRDQFLEACHYTNLQPLWAEENFSKGASLTWEAE